MRASTEAQKESDSDASYKKHHDCLRECTDSCDEGAPELLSKAGGHDTNADDFFGHDRETESESGSALLELQTAVNRLRRRSMRSQ